ncbi:MULTISPECIES: MFS transporter [Rhizobium]|uniref:MFS transporter n=1 Tax=Rhizobium TaxID=379 RepID=UPI0010321FEE|nr:MULTISPECIES: MFS transporter [Rhizobium]TAX05549.1 MFS transporter [Rhizobium leguminosarum]TBF22869.1 MFS transporter [Rhizobium ruizarguesonis]
MTSISSERAAGQSLAPAYIMALGTFAIGTEGFMIVPLLPEMGEDLSLPVSELGSLVTVFTLTLAITSPLLTILFGRVDRKRLLVLTMAAFALANLVAWASQGYWGIFSARVLLAMAAGLYTPNANALMGALVVPEKRGRALAILNGGLTIAIAIGLPIGSLVGNTLGWRVTFLGVAALSIIAVVALVAKLPRTDGTEMRIASVAERLAIVKRPQVFRELAVIFFWALGTYSVWTYIAPYLNQVDGLGPNGISAVVSVWGIGAAIGIVLGGTLNDLMGARPVVAASLILAVLVFVSLIFFARVLTPDQAIVPTVIAVAFWGIAIWAFYPAQIATLIQVGQPAVPIAVSLSTSFMYLGFAVGSAIGSVVLSRGGVGDLGITGVIGEGIALLIATYASARIRQPRSAT